MKLFEKVDQCGRSQHACTTMFFLSPKNVTSERPLALLPTVSRWWEGVWELEVKRWQARHRVGWNATDGRNGGAERTVWETLPEMERFEYCAGEKDQGAITLVLDLAETLERVILPVVWAWATHFNFPMKVLRVLCGRGKARRSHHVAIWKRSFKNVPREKEWVVRPALEHWEWI